MLPNGGKELGLAEVIPLLGWPEDVTRLLDDAEVFPDPLLLLLLGREEPAEFIEPCWLAELEEELDICVDDDWLDEAGGLGCMRREQSNGCDARYGARGRKSYFILLTPSNILREIERILSVYSIST